MKNILITALTVILVACGNETSQTSVTSSTQDLIDGAVDSGHRYSVGICADDLNQDPAKGAVNTCQTPFARCSGTLIAGNLILTARHCIYNIDYSQATDFCSGQFSTKLFPNATIRVTTSNTVASGNPKWYEVSDVFVPTENKSCNSDLAILKLKKTISPAEALPALLQLSDITKNSPKEVAMAGRGAVSQTYDPATYTPATIDEGGFLKRKLEHMPFLCVSNTANTCVVQDDGAPFALPEGYFSTGKGPAKGDSGAGFVLQGTFNWPIPLVVGVFSAFTIDTQGQLNHALGVRLDRHATWINTIRSSHARYY